MNYRRIIIAALPLQLWSPLSVRAEDLPAAASRFRDSATDAYNRAVAICNEETCAPELSQPLAALGLTLGPLNDAIASGVPATILNAVNNANTPLQQLCTGLGLDCQRPLGAGEITRAPDDNIRPAGCSGCYYRSGLCQFDAAMAHASCVNDINYFVGCRKDTPFCDYRDQPFISSQWSACLSGRWRNALLFPGGRDCRCPPGRPERQGGCPEFFGQAPGFLDPPAVCLQGDGQGCGGCCYQKCQRGDGRASCQLNNQWECDVCKFTARIEAAGASMRGACDKIYVDTMAVCLQMWQVCYDLCGDCYNCIIL